MHQNSALLKGKTVVLVEDEGLTQLHLARILSANGMQIVGQASDGAIGVEMVLQSRPDIVLMDISMPVMDGLEAAAQILPRFPTCIVLLTALITDEYRDRACYLGICGYIVKPVDSELLIPMLEEAYQIYQAKLYREKHETE